MPTWAEWMRATGALAAQHRGDGRLVIVVSLPSRCFAAVFVLLGIIEHTYERGPDAAEHWASLKDLPSGTWVRHLDRGKYYSCSKIMHIFERDGEEWLQLTGGLAKRHDKCLDVQPLAEGDQPFNRRNAPREHEFLAQVLPGVDSRAFCASSTPLALAIGSKATLGLESEEVALPVRGRVSGGTAADLVRPRQQPGSPYRTDLVSAIADDLPARAKQRVPVAVLDGAIAALNWRHEVRANAVVVLLDRGVASSEAAVEAMNVDLAVSVSDADIHSLTPVPKGVELLAFVERA